MERTGHIQTATTMPSWFPSTSNSCDSWDETRGGCIHFSEVGLQRGQWFRSGSLKRQTVSGGLDEAPNPFSLHLLVTVVLCRRTAGGYFDDGARRLRHRRRKCGDSCSQ